MAYYYNPYTVSTAYNPYQPQQQSYSMPQAQPQPTLKAMEWVDGEVGARAFQMPAGWPADNPIPLWDTTDTVIYLKSWSQMGMPNPLKKICYEMQEQPLLTSGAASANGNSMQMESNYATKQDLEQMKNELKDLLQRSQQQSFTNYSAANAQQNQNGSNQQNRGGQRNG